MLSIYSGFSTFRRLFSLPSSRLTTCLSFLLLLILSSSTLAEQQHWPLPDEVAASVLHEIPVMHTAFVQIGEELHYLDNQLHPESPSAHESPLLQNEGGGEQKNSNNRHASQVQYNVLKMAGTGKLSIEMDPPMLDFGENSVGTAQKRRIYVRNTKDYPIALDAIVGNSIEFQASFFENFRLEPFKTASVEVVFLPREIGKRTSIIHFYTSDGVFTYKATGDCVANPYRISPFVGVKVPLKGAISKSIALHNPHPYTMRVVEIASSGGNCHIELPHEIDEKLAAEPPQYWDVRPYQTKKLASAVLVGGMTENSTVFIRIAAQLQMPADKILQLEDIIITIPVEVSKERGVYATEEILDFGLMRHGERSNPLMFTVMQYQLGGRLEFETLYVEKGHHTGIYMEFPTNPPIIVPAATRNDQTPGPKADLVKVYFDASRIDYPVGKPKFGKFSGEIIAISRGGNYNASIPFKVDVFQGDLESVGNDLALQEDTRPPHQRIVRIKSNLPFGVAVWNISMSAEAAPHFSVRILEHVVPIKAGDIVPVFVLKYNKKVPAAFDNALIYVHTNVSTFKMKIQKYVGKMQIELTSVEKESFDFGFVERNDTRTIRFIVWNHNQADMKLLNLEVPSREAYRLYEVGTQKKGILFSDVSNDERVEYLQATDVDIPPLCGKIFDLELKVPQDGLVRTGKILFETSLESKVFVVSYKVSTGSLQSIPEEISFGQTFPARLVYRTLQVFNSFDEDMTVTRLTTLNQDPRFFFEGFDANHPPLLRSGRLTNLGRVMFSPQIPCDHEFCYLGFPLNSHDGQWFTHGLTLPANLAEVDSYLYKKQRAKFDELVKSGKNRVNTTMILDTDKAKNIKIKTSAEMIWPRLLTRNSIQFPLTALGNFTIVNLTLANPTSVPVAVQVIPLVIYPDAETLVDLFRPHLLTPLSDHPNLKVEMNETLMFSLRDTELFTLRKDSPVPTLREELEAGIPHSVPRFTLSMILKPFMKVRLRIGFLPSDYTLRSSLLLIRNNLTVMEPVVMYGKGARIEMKVENSEARSKKPLMFEIRPDHLTDCNNPKRLMHKLHSTLTVRRPFQVLNSGEVQFTVTNMSINGVPCENRGFRILNCYPFKLQPNETYSLDIAYTPDFLTTVNEADLQLFMHMNGSAWLFPLAATVPPSLMAKCHQALPRPPFENIMYYSCVTALIFCLVCVLACAYLEGDRAIACAIRQQYAAPRRLFDLNNIALQYQQQQRAEKEKEKKNDENVKKDSWSILRVSSDAWIVTRILVNVANRIVQCVHSVWKWSLFYRKSEKPAVTKSAKSKKKKNPILLVKKAKSGEESDASSAVVTDSQNTTNNNKMVAGIGRKNLPPPSPKVMEGKNNSAKKKNEKTVAQAQSSHQPQKSRDSSIHSTKGGKGKKQVVQKEAEELVEKAEKVESPPPSPSPPSSPPRSPPTPPPPPPQAQQQEPSPSPRGRKKEKPVKKAAPSPKSEPKPRTPSPVKVEVKEEEEKVQPPSPPPPQQDPVVPVAPIAPMAPIAPIDPMMYQQFLAMNQPQVMAPMDLMNQQMWSTPAAQTAMQYMNMWSCGQPLTVEQMQALIGQVGGGTVEAPPPPSPSPPLPIQQQMAPRESITPTPSEVAWMGLRRGGRGDDEDDSASVGTVGTEEAPDWVDEVVTASDAEADFSALAAASTGILTTDDEQEDADFRKRGKSKGKKNRSPSVASSTASSTLSKKLDNSPQKMGSRRLTIGSEKKDKGSFSKAPGPGQPPITRPTLGDGISSLWSSDDYSSVLGDGATPGTSLSNPIWDRGTTSSSQHQDPLSLLGMGMNLEGTSTEFGNTMFTGPEFNLWSDSTFDPMTAWSNLGLNTNTTQKKDNQEEEGKKKE